jgi:hypothetical protein
LSSRVEFIDTGFNTKFLENLELLRRRNTGSGKDGLMFLKVGRKKAV